MSGARTTIISAPVVIQDIIVAGFANPGTPSSTFPTGEFGKPELFGGSSIPDNENSAMLLDRLYQQIAHLVSAASVQHRQNFSPDLELLPDKKNHITRLLTNEFFFYTKMPLTLPEFEILMQKIASLAKTEPVNFHLLLGSFAVRTKDNKVINVVPKIECGPSPKINLIAKNNPSDVDPVYYERDASGLATLLQNINFNKGDSVSKLSITIDGKPITFGFFNVFECQTAGGEFFYSCIEICLDHAVGVAKKRLNEKLSIAVYNSEIGMVGVKIPTQCSHAVLSNWTHLYPPLCVGDITHVDPHYSHRASKMGVSILSSTEMAQMSFGTKANMIVMSPAQCRSLNNVELLMANYHNDLQDFITHYKGPENKLTHAINKQFLAYKTKIIEHNKIEQYKIKLCYRLIKCMSDQPKSSQSSLIKAVINDDHRIVLKVMNVMNNANILLTKERDSLLMLAVIYKQLFIVDLLLKNGANPYLPNIDGQTAIGIADEDALKLMKVFVATKSASHALAPAVNLNDDDRKLVKDLYMRHRLDYYELFNKAANLLGYDPVNRDSKPEKFEKIYRNAIVPGKGMPVGLLSAIKIANSVLSNPLKKQEYDNNVSALHGEAIMAALTTVKLMTDLKKYINNWVKDLNSEAPTNQFWMLFFSHARHGICTSIKNNRLSNFLNLLDLSDEHKVKFMQKLGKSFMLELIKEKGLSNFLLGLNISSSLQIDIIKELDIKNFDITEILKTVSLEMRITLLQDATFAKAIEAADIHLLPHYFEENFEARKVAHEIKLVAYLKKMIDEYHKLGPSKNKEALINLTHILHAEIKNPFTDYSKILLDFKITFEAKKSQLDFVNPVAKKILSIIENTVDNSILSVSMFKKPTTNAKKIIIPSGNSRQPKQ